MYLLIIENNLGQVAEIYDFFEARGHVVDVAYDGASGIEFSERNAYDVIMLNKRLPDMTGFELCS
ncbi:MAG: DNA-binding response regulator, partial [Gammaproteobacteria bacterium]